MCILCRKKQELLSKTGQWINKGGANDPMGRNLTEAEMGTFVMHDPSDKRPKLERARSAAEKENLPLQRSGSVLRRQYSQQEAPTTSRRLSSSEMGSGIPGGGAGGGDPMMSGPMGQRRHPSGPYGHQPHFHHHNQSVHQTSHLQQAPGQSQQQYGFQQYPSSQQPQQGIGKEGSECGGGKCNGQLNQFILKLFARA